MCSPAASTPRAARCRMPRELTAPVAGTISFIAAVGDHVGIVAVVEAMKMEHEVIAEPGGEVTRVDVAVGDTVAEGQLLAHIKGPGPFKFAPREDERSHARGPGRGPRTHAAGLDAARPDAVEKRREQGRRTARENVADLVRRRHVRRVRGAELRRAARAPAERGADREHARRRDRHRASARSTAARGRRLRLHGPRRHAGHPQPPQDGPPARAGRAAAAAGRAVRRGRRRAARRHRLPIVAGLDCRASTRSRGSAGSCRASASSPGAASPATRRCSAAATS